VQYGPSAGATILPDGFGGSALRKRKRCSADAFKVVGAAYEALLGFSRIQNHQIARATSRAVSYDSFLHLRSSDGVT